MFYVLKVLILLVSTPIFAEVTTTPELVGQYLARPFHSRSQFKEALAENCKKDFWDFSIKSLIAITQAQHAGQTFDIRRSHLLSLIKDDAEKASLQGGNLELKDVLLAQVQTLLDDSQKLKLTRRDVAYLIEIQAALTDIQGMDLPALLGQIHRKGKFLDYAIELAAVANDHEKALIAAKARTLIAEKQYGIEDAFIGYALLYWSQEISEQDMVWMCRRMLEVWVKRSTSRSGPDAVGGLLSKTAIDLSRRYLNREKAVYSILKSFERSPGWSGKSWRKHEIDIIREFLRSMMAPTCEQSLGLKQTLQI